jgi:hypothetical protein
MRGPHLWFSAPWRQQAPLFSPWIRTRSGGRCRPCRQASARSAGRRLRRAADAPDELRDGPDESSQGIDHGCEIRDDHGFLLDLRAPRWRDEQGRQSQGRGLRGEGRAWRAASRGGAAQARTCPGAEASSLESQASLARPVVRLSAFVWGHRRKAFRRTQRRCRVAAARPLPSEPASPSQSVRPNSSSH